MTDKLNWNQLKEKIDKELPDKYKSIPLGGLIIGNTQAKGKIVWQPTQDGKYLMIRLI